MGADSSEDSVTNKPLAYILWSISFILISCPLLHISVTFHTDGLWSSRFCWLLYSLRRQENYLHGTPQAAVHLMLWTGGLFLLALLLTRASLRLPRPFIPYKSSTSSSFFSISFLLIFERERPSPLFSSTQPLLPSAYPSLSLKQFFSRRSSYQ